MSGGICFRRSRDNCEPPDSAPMAVFRSVLYAIICFLCSTVAGGCEVDYEASRWGLRSIHHERALPYGGPSQSILFTPPTSSARYEVRLFFPTVRFDVTSERYDALKREIMTCLAGLRYEIESEGGAVISEGKINSSADLDSYSFNSNAPLSLWLDSKLELKQGRQYQITVQPASSGNDSCPDAKFIVGIAHGVYP